MKTLPDISFEKLYWDQGFDVVGMDEVGRGAFAGPVTVAGVSFNSSLNNKKLLSLGINDSKKLTPKKREYLSSKIREIADYFFISFKDVPMINKIGIGRATFLGMEEVAQEFLKKTTNAFFIIDAFEIPKVSIFQRGIIRGDSLSISIAAASIIAKVERDKLMTELSKEFPIYGFDQHKGYGTALHRSLIKKNGVSAHHRLDFCKRTINN